MKNFKVGDKVIALSNPMYGELSQQRVKGNAYIVHDILYCHKCGEQAINIGPTDPDNLGVICECGVEQNSHGLMWTDSSEFVKADLKAIEEKLQAAIVVEDYDSAILLRDIELN